MSSIVKAVVLLPLIRFQSDSTRLGAFCSTFKGRRTADLFYKPSLDRGHRPRLQLFHGMISDSTSANRTGTQPVG